MLIMVLAVIPAGWTVTAFAGVNVEAARRQGDEAYSRNDFSAAAELYRTAAVAGDAVAMTRLGWMCRNGTGVPRDTTQALLWFSEAARSGNAGGRFSLALLYENGLGVTRDYAEAARLYRLAADQGNAMAQNNLGWLYQNGRGVSQDYTKAVRWYRLAAAQNQPDAEGNLGLLYLDGKGVPSDRAEGIRLLRLAASGGDRQAGLIVKGITAGQSSTVEAPPGARSISGSDSPSTIFGQWRSKQAVRDEGLRRFYLTMDIRQGAVTFRYDCRFLDGSILIGSFTSKAEITSGTIRILEGGVSRAGNEENQCEVSIKPATLPYRLNNGDLAITLGSGNTVIMGRS
ncbi:MAG: tetratricopeptide repeat protein [Rhodospirillaceae bacterium]